MRREKGLEIYLTFVLSRGDNYGLEGVSPLTVGIDSNDIWVKDKYGNRLVESSQEPKKRLKSLAKELIQFRGYEISNLSDYFTEEEISAIGKE